MTGNKIELQDIMQTYGQKYKQSYLINDEQKKAMYAIANCRTYAMGSHMEKCSDCGEEYYLYNSCRNRHCPKCQYTKQQLWINTLQGFLLPVSYFHVVYTLPSVLNPLVTANKELMYDMLLKASSGTQLQVSLNPSYLGAQVGFVSILHTWGQNLSLHPHVHMLVPGGGLSTDEMEWIPSGKKFFVPVKILSVIFRARFTRELEKAYRQGKVKIPTSLTKSNIDYSDFRQLKNNIYHTPWVVYTKKAMKGPGQVITYLARYTHRIAISNNRINTMEEGKVSFRWKDYKDHNRWEIMQLDAMEFIRRFLQHVLPKGFYKIRYYGIYASANRKKKLSLCFGLLAKLKQVSHLDSLSWVEIAELFTGRNIRLCPKCRKGILYVITPGFD
jgi:hypothetical protein